MRLQLARALMCPERFAAAGRTDQPPGPGRAGLAGSLAQALPRHHDRDQPRPRVFDAVTNVTLHIEAARLKRATAATTASSRTCAPSRWPCSRPLARQTAGEDRAPAEVHRPLQGQGQQGQAGAKPGQGAGAHGKIAPVLAEAEFTFEFRSRQPAQPDAGHARHASFGYPSERRRPRSSCAA